MKTLKVSKFWFVKIRNYKIEVFKTVAFRNYGNSKFLKAASRILIFGIRFKILYTKKRLKIVILNQSKA